MLGFNPANLRVLQRRPGHRLQPAAIDAALRLDREAGLEPFVVIGTAGHDQHRLGRPAQRPRRPRRSARACGSTSTAPTARPPG